MIKFERINGILISPPIQPKMIAFKRHEKALLSCLHEAHQGGPKFKPFDEARALRDLTSLAKLYFAGKETPKTIPAAEHVKRLRKFVSAIGSARRMANLMQDDLNYDLARAWIAEKNIPLVSRAGRDAGMQALALIHKMIGSLIVLERLACKASDNVRPKRGRPKGGSVLTVDCIHGLARVYKENTGRKPSIVEGPFARFVRAFLMAIGQGDRLSTNYIIEMIGTARNQIRRDDPVLWAISAFNPTGGNNSLRF